MAAEDQRIRTLAEMMAEEGLLSLSRTTRLIGEIATALRAAQESGLTSFHLEPRAILLGEPRDDGSAAGGDAIKVLAFVPTGEPHTTPSTDDGGHQLSLAAIAYEMLAGCSPFAEDSSGVTEDANHPAPAVADAFLAPPPATPPPLSEMVVGVPVALDNVFGRALSFAPDSRFPSLEDFVSALRRIASEITASGADGGAGGTRRTATPTPRPASLAPAPEATTPATPIPDLGNDLGNLWFSAVGDAGTPPLTPIDDTADTADAYEPDAAGSLAAPHPAGDATTTPLTRIDEAAGLLLSAPTGDTTPYLSATDDLPDILLSSPAGDTALATSTTPAPTGEETPPASYPPGRTATPGVGPTPTHFPFVTPTRSLLGRLTDWPESVVRHLRDRRRTPVRHRLSPPPAPPPKARASTATGVVADGAAAVASEAPLVLASLPTTGKPSRRTQVSFLAATVLVVVAAVGVMSGSRKPVAAEEPTEEPAAGPAHGRTQEGGGGGAGAGAVTPIHSVPPRSPSPAAGPPTIPGPTAAEPEVRGETAGPAHRRSRRHVTYRPKIAHR